MEKNKERSTTPIRKLRIRKETNQSKYQQKYLPSWELKFKWITKGSTDTKAKCKSCGDDIKAEITVIKNHEKSAKHIKNTKAISNAQPKINEFAQNSSSITIENKVAEAEIKISGFFGRA